MSLRELQVRKDNIAEARLVSRASPAPMEGEVLAKVDLFALTANNITYGVVGEKIGYWKFFPRPDGWGVIPVWGFADVIESKHPEVKSGERLYGYFPMGTHMILRPERLRPDRLIDASSYRAELPPVYNAYARVSNDPLYDAAMDEERAALHPLYATSFCLHDFLIDNDWFGAAQVVVASASSKTAIGLAYALQDDKSAPASVGLTSARNEEKVRAFDLYGSVATYDRLDAIDASTPTVIIDMSGDGAMLSALHAHLGDNMRYCSNVGVTHYEANSMGPGFIAERSAMFFAPGHIQKRASDWGPGEFEKRALAFWKDAAVRSRCWLTFERIRGGDALEEAYHEIREGRSSPDKAVIVSV